MMYKWILVLTLVLAGCGTSAEKNEPGKETENNTNGGGSGIIAGSVEPELQKQSSLNYIYTIKNQTEKEVEMKFPTSQRFDYSVKDKDGAEVFLFSSAAFFLQAEGEEVLKPAEELNYDINLSQLKLAPGTYTLEAWMTQQDGEDYKVTEEITIN
jgi:Intracellular proteinase inhibitor